MYCTDLRDAEIREVANLCRVAGVTHMGVWAASSGFRDRWIVDCVQSFPLATQKELAMVAELADRQ